MTGKSYILILTYIFCLSLTPSQASPRKAYLRSGLLYEKHHSDPILVNPTQLTFYRQLNLTLLLQTHELLKQYTKSYIEFCDHIRGTNVANKPPKRSEFYFIPLTNTIDRSRLVCENKHYNGKLPEIKTYSELLKLRDIANSNNLKAVPAGIYYDNSTRLFRYFSNNEIVSFSLNTFQSIAYHINGSFNEKITMQHNKLHEYANTHKLMYEFNTNQLPILKFYGHATYNTQYNTICQDKTNERPIAADTSLLMKMVSHTCLRDYQGLNATTNLLETEIKDFISPPRNRVIRQTKNNEIECYSNICKNLSTIINLIESNSQIITNLNITTDHAKLITIYYTVQNHNLTKLKNYEQFINFMFTNNTSNQLFKSDPQAELIYFYTKDLVNKIMKTNYNITLIKNIPAKAIRPLQGLANSTDPSEFFNHFIKADLRNIRYKRHPAMIMGGGLLLANSVSSFITGESPFSWFGNILSSTLGLATRTDLKNILTHLKHHATAISDITINQEQLYDSYLHVRQNIINLQSVASKIEYGTANMAVELDNKLAIKHLQFVIQLTLLKIASAFTAASSHKTSPYIFSQEELERIAISVQNKKIFLSTNMNDVIVNVVQNNTQIIFTFTIPVLDERSLFNFYEAKTIPIFQHNKSYTANIDLRFFAITANTNEYSIISESEYYFCLTNKQCQISDVIHPINSEAHCTVQTFQENKQLCELTPTNKLEKPFFAFYGNRTFFSVPQPIVLRITCQETPLAYVTETQTKTVSGTGFIEIKQSCSIILPDNRKYFSNPILEAEYLDPTNFMAILKQSQPTILNFTFQIPEPIEPTTEAPFTLKPVNISLIHQIYQEITEPVKALSTTATFFLILFCIGILACLPCCCSKCYRTWFSTCTLFKNPREWWTEYKKYDINTFDKLHTSTYFKILQNIRRKTPHDTQKQDTNETHPDNTQTNTNTLVRSEPITIPNTNMTTRYSDETFTNIYPQFLYEATHPQNPQNTTYAQVHHNQ